MKKLMITGGMIGFAIAVATGLANQSGWPAILCRASIAALFAGIMLRWWGKVWLQSWEQACNEKLLAQERAESAATASPKS